MKDENHLIDKLAEQISARTSDQIIEENIRLAKENSELRAALMKEIKYTGRRVSIKERLPEVGERCVFHLRYGVAVGCYLGKDEWKFEPQFDNIDPKDIVTWVYVSDN